MGNVKKLRKKYHTPKKLWEKNTIVSEKELTKKYGFKNKKEIWKINTLLANFKAQAKKIIRTRGEQSEVEKAQLMGKLTRLGLINENATIDDVLSLSNEDIMGRRLQTLVYKKGLAGSVKQARQLIVHKHIAVGDSKLTAPSYMCTLEEEGKISYSSFSRFASESHPEREMLLNKQKGGEGEVKQSVTEEVAE